VIADALQHADPVGARAAEHETNWRRNYLTHYRRAVEAGIGRPADAESIARHGLSSMREQMLYGDVPVGDAITGCRYRKLFIPSRSPVRVNPRPNCRFRIAAN